MANDKSFKIKNGLQAGRYLGTNGTETAGSEAYSVSGLSYDSVTYDPSTQETNPSDFAFNSDGTKVYIIGYATDSLYQYSLSTAYNVSTASYDSVSFSFATQGTNTSGLDLKSDGTKLYTVDSTSDAIFQYSLSTAYDASTLSYDSVTLSVTSQMSNPTSIRFKPDGTKAYVVGANNDTLYQYGLSTAWDLSTASYDNVSLSLSSGCQGFTFNTDGTKFFVSDSTTDVIYGYSLSTAYDITTASLSQTSPSVATQVGNPRGIRFISSGNKLILAGVTGSVGLFQYSTVAYTQTLDLSTGHTFSFTPSGATTVSFSNPPASGVATGFTVEVVGDGSAITWPSSVKWHLGTAPTATASKEVYTFITTDGGTTYYAKLAGSNIA